MQLSKRCRPWLLEWLCFRCLVPIIASHPFGNMDLRWSLNPSVQIQIASFARVITIYIYTITINYTCLIYIYIYTYIHIVCIYIYIIERERDREKKKNFAGTEAFDNFFLLRMIWHLRSGARGPAMPHKPQLVDDFWTMKNSHSPNSYIATGDWIVPNY